MSRQLEMNFFVDGSKNDDAAPVAGDLFGTADPSTLKDTSMKLEHSGENVVAKITADVPESDESLFDTE